MNFEELMQEMPLCAMEIKKRLRSLGAVDRDDFYSDGFLDLDKAKSRGKLHQIKSVTCDEFGYIEDVQLYNDFSGYIYLIQAANGLTKIGKSADVHKRLNQIKANSPVDVKLIYSKFVKDADAEEKWLHKLYSGQRIRGEWFRLDDLDVADIRESLQDG